MAGLEPMWALALATGFAALTVWFACSPAFVRAWLHGRHVPRSVRLSVLAYGVFACNLISWAFLGIGEANPFQAFLLAWLLALGIFSFLMRARELRSQTASST